MACVTFIVQGRSTQKSRDVFDYRGSSYKFIPIIINYFGENDGYFELWIRCNIIILNMQSTRVKSWK